MKNFAIHQLKGVSKCHYSRTLLCEIIMEFGVDIKKERNNKSGHGVQSNTQLVALIVIIAFQRDKTIFAPLVSGSEQVIFLLLCILTPPYRKSG